MKKLKSAVVRYSFLWPSLLLIGCATYYQQNLVFQDYFSKGQIEEANSTLDKNKKVAKSNNKLLYFLQKGTVQQLMDNYEESNSYFEQAYYFTEDARKNYSLELLSFFVNPNVKPYVGEDHEKVMLHYFKAMNFLRMGSFEEALVECRRINIKLNELNDRYGDKKNRYAVDPFAHNLMGIAYEASGQVNDAFIAYRNAHNAYSQTKDFFGISTPEQLKIDLLRTAYLNGFNKELEAYQKEFGRTYTHKPSKEGELLFFWHNGLGPVKSEWSINFFVIRGEGGIVHLENKELGLSFPFSVPRNNDGSSQLGDLKIVRVAFPKYIDRTPYFKSAKVTSPLGEFNLEKAEDISAIAFTTLEDRMLREFANSLIRLAVKQASELAVRKDNENLGAILSIVNAATEKADTRNWQTLPHDISYSRIPLNEGNNTIKLNTLSHGNEKITNEFSFTGEKGKTIFHIFHSLESSPPSANY